MTRYSSQFRPEKKQSRIRTVVKNISWRGTLIVGLVALSGLYVFQTTAVSVKGYDMTDLEREMTRLRRDTQGLDVEIAKYRSMDSIKKRLPELQLVAASEVRYVNAVGSAVARR